MAYTAEILKEELQAAAGTRAADLVITNVNLVNVYTDEIYPAAISIYNGRIISIAETPPAHAKQVLDGQGSYALPGFIDTHVHIETTLLTPEALGEVIAPWGSTSLCVDAMEIANVAGIEGLLALVRDADQLPFRLFMEVPSRVPTAPGLETTGGVLDVEEVARLLAMEESVSLGELDPSKILGMREPYLDKILAALNCRKICNGHAIGLEPADLNIYAAGHLSDDHESVYYEELLNRLRLGIKPLIREGSSERNVELLVKGVLEHGLPMENIMFCTDDKHVNDIHREGHISYNVQRAIDLGMNPVDAIKIATINAARHFRLEDQIGALAPGRFADVLLVRDLREIKPWLVLKEGRVVADEGGPKPCTLKEYPPELLDTVHLSRNFSRQDFKLDAAGNRVKCRVISLIRDQIINEAKEIWMEVSLGEIEADVSRDILKLAVVERYGKNGRTATALVEGFGLKKGAMASSVSHDHHNVVVVGTNDMDMAIAVREVERLHGGFVLVVEGRVVDALALPLGGLMSLLPAGEVLLRMDELNAAVQEFGCALRAPFMTLSFISLPTVPKLGLTDYGLIDVAEHRITNLILEIAE